MNGNDNRGITVTTGTVQFLIQLGILLVTICAFGFSIQNAVQVQGVRSEAQQKTIDSLERKIELMRYELQEMKLDLASKGVLTVKKGQGQ